MQAASISLFFIMKLIERQMAERHSDKVTIARSFQSPLLHLGRQRTRQNLLQQ